VPLRGADLYLHHVEVVDQDPVFITRAKSALALSRVGAMKGIRPIEISKTVWPIEIIKTRCRLTSANRPTPPQCDIEGVVIFGLRYHSIKR